MMRKDEPTKNENMAEKKIVRRKNTETGIVARSPLRIWMVMKIRIMAPNPQNKPMMVALFQA